MKIELNFKDKKAFILKIGILLFGIPGGVFTGLLWYVLMEEGFTFLWRWKFLIVILYFIAIQVFVGYLIANRLWKVYDKKIVSKKTN
jgi:hypothetical protein